MTPYVKGWQASERDSNDGTRTMCVFVKLTERRAWKQGYEDYIERAKLRVRIQRINDRYDKEVNA